MNDHLIEPGSTAESLAPKQMPVQFGRPVSVDFSKNTLTLEMDAGLVVAVGPVAVMSLAAYDELRDALRDMLAGWVYIRQSHGDLYGVGWDRAQNKAEAALANAPCA